MEIFSEPPTKPPSSASVMSVSLHSQTTRTLRVFFFFPPVSHGHTHDNMTRTVDPLMVSRYSTDKTAGGNVPSQ